MEKELVLKYNIKLDNKTLSQPRRLSYKRIWNSFLFRLDDGFTFFISLTTYSAAESQTKDKIIVRPRNVLINKILSLVDQDSMQEQLILACSPDIPLMHLINAIFLILRDLRIEFLSYFEGFSFKVAENENNHKVVVDCDSLTEKEVVCVKSGGQEIFMLESQGEITTNDFHEIIKSL